MANRTELILESIRINEGDEAYRHILEVCGAPEEGAAPGKQAKYVEAVLHEFLRTYGENLISCVLRPCGQQCISNGTVAKAKTLYKKSAGLEDFLALLNKERIGGGKLYLHNGNIIGSYDKCYCGLAKAAKGMPPAYCHCSAGWFERLFSSVFEKSVEVKKLHTILDGSEDCVFEIYIG